MKIYINRISIFSILIILLPIMTYVNLGVKLNISLADFILPIAILLVLFDIKRTKRKIIKSNLHKIYIIGIMLVLTCSLYKVHLFYDISNFINSSINVVKLIINFIYFLIFVYIFKYYGYKFEKKFLLVWNYTSIVVSIMCILGVILYNMGIENNWSYSYRATGPFEDPNLASVYIFISIGISLIYNYKKNSNIISYNTILQVIAIFLTASRGALIILVISTLIVITTVIIKNDINLINITLKFIGIAFIVFLLVIFTNESIEKFEFFSRTLNRLASGSSDIMADSRIKKWINAIIIWMNNPVFGSGIGMYIERKVTLGLGNDRIVAHNTYLSILSELGIVGFISFFWLPIKLMFSIWKNYSKNDIVYPSLIFSMSALFISQVSLNLENFRCMWVFYAFVFYYIKKIREDEKYE